MMKKKVAFVAALFAVIFIGSTCGCIDKAEEEWIEFDIPPFEEWTRVDIGDFNDTEDWIATPKTRMNKAQLVDSIAKEVTVDDKVCCYYKGKGILFWTVESKCVAPNFEIVDDGSCSHITKSVATNETCVTYGKEADGFINYKDCIYDVVVTGEGRTDPELVEVVEVEVRDAKVVKFKAGSDLATKVK